MSNPVIDVAQTQGSLWNAPALCACGEPRKTWQRYCPDCRRARRKGYAELTTDAQRRANARSYLNVYVKRGKVAVLPCADCGAPEVEAHHPDYSRPLDVVWLCRSCHEKRHGVQVDRVKRWPSRADGGKPPSLYDFYRAIHARGLTTESIAAAIGRSRPTVTRVLNGSRRAGPIWKRIQALLLPAELALLEKALSGKWAKQRIAKRPKWKTVQNLFRPAA